MTSGNFAMIPVASIVVDREGRQRRELTGIEELAASIAARGLINPITIDRNMVLIAGERRLTAIKSLGLPEVAVQFIEDLPLTERKLIELEENVRRKDLEWRDYVISVAEIHRIQSEAHDTWTAEKTAEFINMSPQHVSNVLLVHRNLDHDLVKTADKFSVARNVAMRYEERQEAAGKRDLDVILSQSLGLPEPEQAAPEAAPSRPPLRAEIHHGEFQTLLPSLALPPFNFIHCDFPYGVGAGDKSGQSAAKITGSYADTPDIYFELLKQFCLLTPIIAAESAHLMFWFSMDYYDVTRKILAEAGWKTLVRPLIWHKSDNAGILPDKDRGPRQTYETALFGVRGDRKIVRAVANSFSGPTAREHHTSEKPRPMLEHFFRMFVDDTTRMLDPTAGSGNAVRVASELGAVYALGVERDADFAARADANLRAASDDYGSL